MTEIAVLDKGFVRLVDHMGDDKRIVDAARVSYANQDEDSEFSAGDVRLIRYLMRNRHTSPFEKVRFEFHVKCPKPIAVQWMRHRTGSFNEVSGRYTELPDEYYEPEVFRTNRGVANKQSSIPMGGNEYDVIEDEWYYTLARGDTGYRNLLNEGVAKEQARFVTPYGFYTQFYWTVDLHNLLHFLSLRMDSHAQLEIQEYGKAIAKLIEPIVPVSFQAWKEFVLHSVTLSAEEAGLVRWFLERQEHAFEDERDQKTFESLIEKMQ